MPPFESLTASEIEAEAAAERPASYFEAELPDLPLTRLRNRTFEILAFALAEAEIATHSGGYTRATLLREGPDQGRDVLLLKGERVAGVIQCKRYSSVINLPFVLRELMRFALRAIRDPELVPDADDFSYQFWTAGEITSKATEFFAAPRTYINANRSDALEAAQKARSTVAALKCEDGRVSSGENEAALALVLKCNITTLGPVEIKSRLADHEKVRHRFFRGPNDHSRRAKAGDVEALMGEIRREQKSVGSANLPYVRRALLDREFGSFMLSPARILAVVGGSGQGKSTWSRWVRDHPPAAMRVDVVRGEDIHLEDQHVADTIARLLRSRPLGDLTATDLVQGVLDWIDDVSRLLFIDGIDRVPASTLPGLHDWLTRTFALTKRHSTRFVVTSRPAAWTLIAPDVEIDKAQVYFPNGASAAGFPSLELGPLPPEEVRQLYSAYGLATPRRLSRPFRTPGLIAREAAIHAVDRVRLGTRVAVMEASIDDLGRQLRRVARIGSQQFKRFLDVLGDTLVEAGDGRLSASAFRNRAPDVVPTLDAMIAADFAIAEGDLIRVEPDDFIEYLMALRLDLRHARALLDGRNNDLLIGATAMAVALLERHDEKSVRTAISTLRDGARGDSAALAAAARAITELKGERLIREEVGAMLRAWTLPNLLLDFSPLVRMLREVDLSALDRLELTLILASGEDEDDWRGKYFYDPDQETHRVVTGFGRAAANAIAEDPHSSLKYLIRLVDDAKTSGQFDDYQSVLSGLLYLAIQGAPADAAKIAWVRRSQDEAWLLDRVSRVAPEAVAVLLGTILSPEVDRDAAIERLWSMTSGSMGRLRKEAAFRSAVAGSAQIHLPSVTNEHQTVRLLIMKLLGNPAPSEESRSEESRLADLWAYVDDEIFWIALQSRSRDRLKLFADRFGNRGRIESKGKYLAMIPVDLFAVEEWSGVAAVLETAEGLGLGNDASLALETLLYRAAGQDELDPLMPLARKFASSKDASVRRPVIYFAGGPSAHRHQSALRQCEELLGLLVEHERGETLRPLVWKLIQSAEMFQSAAARLLKLCDRCGDDAVNQQIEFAKLTDPSGFDAVKREWEQLPEEGRPVLPGLNG